MGIVRKIKKVWQRMVSMAAEHRASEEELIADMSRYISELENSRALTPFTPNWILVSYTRRYASPDARARLLKALHYRREILRQIEREKNDN